MKASTVSTLWSLAFIVIGLISLAILAITYDLNALIICLLSGVFAVIMFHRSLIIRKYIGSGKVPFYVGISLNILITPVINLAFHGGPDTFRISLCILSSTMITTFATYNESIHNSTKDRLILLLRNLIISTIVSFCLNLIISIYFKIGIKI